MMELLYKAGTKVRIKSFEAIKRINSEALHGVISFNHGGMRPFCNNVYTLKSIEREKNIDYHYNIWKLNEDAQWIWDERWFEPVNMLPEDLFTI